MEKPKTALDHAKAEMLGVILRYESDGFTVVDKMIRHNDDTPWCWSGLKLDKGGHSGETFLTFVKIMCVDWNRGGTSYGVQTYRENEVKAMAKAMGIFGGGDSDES